MAASYKGTCYPDTQAALSAACVGDYPQTGSDATGSWSVACTGVDAPSLLLERSSAAASEPQALTLVVGTAPCSMGSLSAAPTADQLGAAFAFGFVGVMTVYCIAWGFGRVLDAIGR